MDLNRLPKIIQGGMGIGVSGWELAKAVSLTGQLGVVAGTALDSILVRKLQDGDASGDMRRALNAFPLKSISEKLIDKYYVPGGKDKSAPYKAIPMSILDGPVASRELCVAANFVEVFLAKEGHKNPVGINYLEKVTFPIMPSIYGAMLAGIDYVIIGAGIPKEIPGVLNAFVDHKTASYPTRVSGTNGEAIYRMEFDPKDFMDGEELTPLKLPAFLPIISTAVLGAMLIKRGNGKIDGFVVEGSSAGGHNAPPRGAMRLDADNQPIYGDRDVADPAAIRKLGLPFWLAGSYGSHSALEKAIEAGAAGIQVGTAFALCNESGITTELKSAIMKKALAGNIEIKTSAFTSPTGFPFKVAQLEGTLSEDEVYNNRRRICDMGYLREPYYKDDGSIGYRCPAENIEAYIKKGGKEEATKGRKCICNALIANIGMAQQNKSGVEEPPIITCGNDVVNIAQFVTEDSITYSAADAVKTILGS